MFRKMLVANRGEIALRVIRACREMGISPVAVYVSSDREGLWIQQADEAYELSGFEDRAGYLSIEGLLGVARKARVEAVHPGYGFLSEDARFARACGEAGLAFIGPSPEAMRKAGDKVEARKLAEALGLPVLPGTPPVADWKEAESKAGEVGYPLLIKAAAGGGGRGMRLVRDPAEMRPAFESACREAEASFGSGKVYFEKFVARPRHLEIQVMADQHGGAFHLGERECSIQRRYQKLVEESPSPLMDEPLRAQMGESALRFIKGIGYTNAGTVEFLLDEKRRHYFLEMNARIQVEHPVTELVTGIDLVKTQIEVAAGKKLAWRQEEIKLNGWAFEARLNGEDPLRNFLPAPGRVERLHLPGGAGIRVDTALHQGYRIPVAFDSLLAKLLAWGRTREEAAARMRRALSEIRIGGIPTTIPFHARVFSHPAFLKGDLSTRFIEDHLQASAQEASAEEMDLALAAFALEMRRPGAAIAKGAKENAWGKAGRLESVNPPR